MAGGYLLGVSAASTAASVVGLIWWMISELDEVKVEQVDAGSSGGGGSKSSSALALQLLSSSSLTVVLLVNFFANFLILVVLLLKALFFVQLHASEPRNLLERLINYMIYKGTFLPLVVSSNIFQVVLWSTWLFILCFLKMFQLLARDRLERLNASPTTTQSMYFRVYSALLLVFSADILWMKLCVMINTSLISTFIALLFFEPLSIAFETLQAIMVHGFQLFEISQRHSVDTNSEVDPKSKTVAGYLSEWKGFLVIHCGFILDLLSLVMGLGHYLMTWWLRGMTLHLADVILFLYSRALVSAIVKRVKVYIKLWKALASLDGVLPDATYQELCAYNDECAICRGPMARAKRLTCGHLFHLACLRSWLDRGLTDGYSCPSCWRPLCFSNVEGHSHVQYSSNTQQLLENPNFELSQQIVSDNTLPVGAFPSPLQDPSDSIWRGGGGFNAGWVHPWTNPGVDGASSSGAMGSVGLSRVQMMVRQLASVSENYTHGSLDGRTWNLWPPHHASSSSSIPAPSSSRSTRSAWGMRFRNVSPFVNGPEIITMVNRVREVLPHIPDELIIQDLLRTNNINLTVNNLLVQ